MRVMRELGSFGDERLKKGGRIFWPLLWRGVRRVSGVWARRGPAKFDLAGFCTTLQ
jgi:hypothetical protein